MAEDEFPDGGWSIPRMVGKLWKDTYHGNGLPGFSTRIKDAEDSIERLERIKAEVSEQNRMEARVTTLERQLKDSADRRETKMNILLATTLTAVVGILVDLLTKHVK